MMYGVADALETHLTNEAENGRLLKLLIKLGTINERPEQGLDPRWSDSGDRYILKLFRNFLFHQVDDDGTPVVDVGHIVNALNKIDCGDPEQLCLASADQQTILISSFSHLKRCLDESFSQLCGTTDESSGDVEVVNQQLANMALQQTEAAAVLGHGISGLAAMSAMGPMAGGMAASRMTDAMRASGMPIGMAIGAPAAGVSMVPAVSGTTVGGALTNHSHSHVHQQHLYHHQQQLQQHPYQDQYPQHHHPHSPGKGKSSHHKGGGSDGNNSAAGNVAVVGGVGPGNLRSRGGRYGRGRRHR